LAYLHDYVNTTPSRLQVLIMALLPRKGILAIAAVIDIAINGRKDPVAAKALAARHGLPPRHLEPVLQALVRQGILKGIRGPRGGYELARESGKITVDEILRAAGTVEDAEDAAISSSDMLGQVVMPALAQAERAFSEALSEISVESLARGASPAGTGGGGSGRDSGDNKTRQASDLTHA
jgi:Rrf2 family iron-sulfur cluster assembly transcriptional regulator